MPYKDPEKKREPDKAYRAAHKGQDRYLSYGREWRARNREKVRLAQQLYDRNHRVEKRAYYKTYAAKLKAAAFQAYGGPICVCCNETHVQFLSMDHINGGGNVHRRKIGLKASHPYKWLKDNGYPLGFRVLCMNCNFSIGLLKYCPHSQL